jgi:hypothetical protein
MSIIHFHYQANLPNLRRLFVEARTEAEENEYSRTAVCSHLPYLVQDSILKVIAVLQPRPLYLLGRRLQLSSTTNEWLEVGKMMNAMTLYCYHFVNLRVAHSTPCQYQRAQ